MAIKEKAKPKSNRAKFTIQKKAEKEKPKPKIEKEAPIKDVKVVKKEPNPKVEAKKVELPPEKAETQDPPAHLAEAPAKKDIEQGSSSPTKEEQPNKVEKLPDETPQTKMQMPVEPEDIARPEPEPVIPPKSTELSNNPFAIDLPTSPETSSETHENTTIPSPHSETEVAPNSTEPTTVSPKEEPVAQTNAPVELETSGNGKGILLYFIIVALVAFVVGIGSMAAFTFGFGKMHGMKLPLPNFAGKNSPTPTQSTTLAPTLSPTKSVDLSAYTIKILNGSGITGIASKLKIELATAGFKVISTANADRSDYTDTIIFAKKDTNQEYMTKLKDILKKEYSLGPDSQLPNAATQEADIIITIGSTTAK